MKPFRKNVAIAIDGGGVRACGFLAGHVPPDRNIVLYCYHHHPTPGALCQLAPGECFKAKTYQFGRFLGKNMLRIYGT